MSVAGLWNGTGDRSALATAAMREVKAEGGWGVVCTENMMVDAWSDISPFPAVRLWSDEDLPGQREMPAASLVVVTSRMPNDRLLRALQAQPQALSEAGIERVDRIGDCDAPGLIAHAVFAGHRLARRFDAPEEEDPCRPPRYR